MMETKTKLETDVEKILNSYHHPDGWDDLEVHENQVCFIAPTIRNDMRHTRLDFYKKHKNISVNIEWKLKGLQSKIPVVEVGCKAFTVDQWLSKTLHEIDVMSDDVSAGLFHITWFDTIIEICRLLGMMEDDDE